MSVVRHWITEVYYFLLEDYPRRALELDSPARRCASERARVREITPPSRRSPL